MKGAECLSTLREKNSKRNGFIGTERVLHYSEQKGMCYYSRKGLGMDVGTVGGDRKRNLVRRTKAATEGRARGTNTRS